MKSRLHLLHDGMGLPLPSSFCFSGTAFRSRIFPFLGVYFDLRPLSWLAVQLLPELNPPNGSHFFPQEVVALIPFS